METRTPLSPVQNPEKTPPSGAGSSYTTISLAGDKTPAPVAEKQRVTARACFLGLVASIGGFMFGYVR